MLRTGSSGSVLSAFTLILHLLSPSKDVCVEDACKGNELGFKLRLSSASEAG